MSDVRGSYDFLAFAVIFLTVITLVGLLRKKRWGRELAVAWNVTAFMVAIGGRILGYLFIIIYLQYPVSDSSILWKMDYEFVASFVAAIISISLIIVLSRQSIKSKFERGF